jgi:hypothetical protein
VAPHLILDASDLGAVEITVAPVGLQLAPRNREEGDAARALGGAREAGENLRVRRIEDGFRKGIGGSPMSDVEQLARAVVSMEKRGYHWKRGSRKRHKESKVFGPNRIITHKHTHTHTNTHTHIFSTRLRSGLVVVRQVTAITPCFQAQPRKCVSS